MQPELSSSFKKKEIINWTGIFVIVNLILITILCTSISAQINPGYDAALNTLPENQGWSILQIGNNTTPTVSNETLHQEAMSASSIYSWSASPAGTIDFDSPNLLIFEAEIKVIMSEYNTFADDSWRTGYGLSIVDEQNRVFIVGISDTGVRLTNASTNWLEIYSSSFYHFDTTLAFNDYQLVISNSNAKLFINDSPVLMLTAGSPQNLSNWVTNAVRFGDLSLVAKSVTDLHFISFQQIPAFIDCDPCFPWKNHGEYIRCVSHGVEEMVYNGDISKEEGHVLVSTAAKSDIGKKNYVPPECQ